MTATVVPLRPRLVPSAANILRVYREAAPEELAAGQEWYRRARELAEELDPADPERAAAVIAVLSPQLPWRKNVEVARAAYEARAAGATVDEITAAAKCLKKNARKAAELLWGAAPDGVVSGPKVRSFWHCIAHPESPQAVCIDRHAFDVAVGYVCSAFERDKQLARKGEYAEVADAYLRAARTLREQGEDVTAAEVQAVTWTVWRRRYAQAFHGDDVAAA